MRWLHGCRRGRVRIIYWILTCCIFFCRPSLSCSLHHPFKNSHIIRPISTSCPKLYKTSDQATSSSMAPHVKARCPEYPGSKVKRFPVPDNKVDWSQRWPQYQPVSYTAPSVLTKPVWADPDIGWATKTWLYVNHWLNPWRKMLNIYLQNNLLNKYMHSLQLILSKIQHFGWCCGQDKLHGLLQSRKWKATVSY